MGSDYWNTDYWHAMDRSSGKSDVINISPSQLAISHGIGDPLQGLKSKIFEGARQVELGFMGTGKGFRSQPTSWTPESVSRTEREDIRQLAKVNEVTLSTHASPSVSVSGLTKEGFSEEQSEKALHEIKKAIEFAADTAGGGPVVLHSQEFPRPLADQYKKEKFEQYPGEEEKAPIYLADEHDGRLIALRRDTKVAVPQGGWGNPQRKEDGTIEWEMRSLNDMYRESIKKGEDKTFADFYKDYERKELDLNRGEEKRWGLEANDAQRHYGMIKKAREAAEEQAKKGYAAQAQYSVHELLKSMRGGAPEPGTDEHKEYIKDPIKYLKEHLEERFKNQAESLAQISQSHGSRFKETEERLNRIRPIEEVGVERSSIALARAAMFGYDIEKKRGLERPIMIAPENYEPEIYGSHPQEMKKLIQESRKQMVNMLVTQKGLSKKDAQETAQDRIKATFDIGHLNMWRKFFQGSDEDFKKWVSEQVDDLTKSNVLGHVHLTDNFGYHDEHLTPGEGTAPIKELMRKLEKKGFKGTIVAEPGGQPEGQLFRSLTGLWKLSNYPIYRVDSQQRSWTDIEGSYFGRTGSPTFVVGDYAPSKDWTLWSETPLE